MSELPKGWTQSNLGELVDYGTTAKVEPANIGNDEWVLELEDIEKDTSRLIQRFTFGDRKSKSTKNRFSAGDVLYGKLRPNLNKVLLAIEAGVCTTEIVPLRCPADMLPAYLFYALKRSDFLDYVAQISHGIDMPRLGTEAGRAAEVPLAPLPEQRRIVAKIDSLTGKSRRACDHLEHIPRLVEKYKEALLAAAFRGELTKEWSTKSAVRTAWEKTSPAEHFVWASGKNLPTKKQITGTVPVIGGNGIGGYHNEALINFPTLVIGRVGAQCGNVHFSAGPAWITDNAIYARSISDRVDLAFAILFFRNADLNQLAGGSGQPYVNQSTLNALVLDLPSLDEQREIVRRVERMIAWIDRLASEATSARRLINHLDQAVLAKAFRGELVPQDAADEPASVLLDRIRAERGATSKARRGRKRRSMP